MSTAVSALWQVSPRSDGADRPAPAARNLGVGLLVTALAHLPCHHVRNLVRRLDWIGLDSRFRVFLVFLPTLQKIEAG
jgi:hypothetical protein